MKLTYWKAQRWDGESDAYSIRERTKKAAKAALAEYSDPTVFGPIEKVVIEYRDAFGLMLACTGEGSRA